MDLSFSAWFKKIPLIRPYNLSFGPIENFDTFYLIFRSLEDKKRFGVGEITPLPGYNHETEHSVKKDLYQILQQLKLTESLDGVLTTKIKTSPFVVSGVITALELISNQKFVYGEIDRPIKLTALCDAPTLPLLEKRANELISIGYCTLKMKVGKHIIKDELKRIQKVSSVLSKKATIRLDANQGYQLEQASKLCEGLEDIEHVSLLEQPFKPHQWKETEILANKTQVPIMLDESIWNRFDLKRAADIGITNVKFKLCKHMGIQGSLNLIKAAEFYNLGVVYGNGVQTEIGNHYEALIHSQEKIKTASESNGFLKIKKRTFENSLKMEDGLLFDTGFDFGRFPMEQWQCIIPETKLSLKKLKSSILDIQKD